MVAVGKGIRLISFIGEMGKLLILQVICLFMDICSFR